MLSLYTLFLFFCGNGGNRTPDTRIFSPLLYRLSYVPAVIVGANIITLFKPGEIAAIFFRLF